MMMMMLKLSERDQIKEKQLEKHEEHFRVFVHLQLNSFQAFYFVIFLFYVCFLFQPFK